MPDFSIILQSPDVRALVQENLLERAFHDSLFPRLLFRGEAAPVQHPGQAGDTIVYTSQGLIKPKLRPLVPGVDPVPSTYQSEQWIGQLQQYGDTVDVHMPTSGAAAASLFLRKAQQLGMSGGMSLNRASRNALYNAAEAGWTVADGAQGPAATIRVKRLNGFTRARRPDLALGSAVGYAPVSGNNTLAIRIWDTTGAAAWVSRQVSTYTPDTVGDETGPGTITITGGTVTVTDRAAIQALDRTSHVQVGGGESTDAIGAGDHVKLADIRSAVTRFWDQNVPENADGFFHLHLDPTQHGQVFSDSEWNRLFTATGVDSVQYRNFALGQVLGCAVFRNSECPKTDTVDPGDGVTFSQDDPFAGELYSNGLATGPRVHRSLLVAQGAMLEHYSDLGALLTEAGIAGKIAEPRITNNGIEVFTDRVQLIIRQPLDRLAQMLAVTWNFIGTFVVRTDNTTGDAARYKRVQAILGGE